MGTIDYKRLSSIVSQLLANPGDYRDSHSNPCPVCGHTGGWCLSSQDPKVVICGKREVGSIRRCGEAGWLHVLDDMCQNVGRTNIRTRTSSRPPGRVGKPKNKNSFTVWRRRTIQFMRVGEEKRRELAVQLGVSPESLRALGVGYNPCNFITTDEGRRILEGCWTFPERDGIGQIVGINRRFINGSKKRMPGSTSGLTCKKTWDDGSTEILLAEGGSDTAALLTMGLVGIGRPSNCGGVKLLTEMLCSVAMNREIIVIGERDEKPNGHWPGRDGAIATAEKLAEALDRPIFWALPPDDAKDVRAWLQAQTQPTNCADRFLQGLAKELIKPPIVHVPTKPSGEIVEIDSWRGQLLQARLESLSTVGVYLDRSPTGSGKSHADQEALRIWIEEH